MAGLRLSGARPSWGPGRRCPTAAMKRAAGSWRLGSRTRRGPWEASGCRFHHRRAPGTREPRWRRVHWGRHVKPTRWGGGVLGERSSLDSAPWWLSRRSSTTAARWAAGVEGDWARGLAEHPIERERIPSASLCSVPGCIIRAALPAAVSVGILIGLGRGGVVRRQARRHVWKPETSLADGRVGNVTPERAWEAPQSLQDATMNPA